MNFPRSSRVRATVMLLSIAVCVGGWAPIADASPRAASTPVGAASAPTSPGGPFAISFGNTVSDGKIDNVPTAGAGNLEVDGEEDVYTFDVPAGGQRAYFEAISEGPYPGNYWSLLDSAGHEYFDDNGYTTVGPLFMPANSYRLTVRSYHGLGGMNHGPYSFKLWNVETDRVPVTLTAPGDGVAIADSIDTPYEADEYPFTISGTARQLYLQRITGCSCTFRIRDAAGHVVAEADNAAVGPFYAPAGDYTLRVRGTYGRWNVNYSMKLWTLPAPDTKASLALGATQAGNLESPVAQDVYTYTLSAGATVTLDGDNYGDMRYALFAPDGQQLLTTQPGQSYDSVVTLPSTPATGIYKVTAQSHTYAGARTYSMTLRSTPTATPTEVPTKFPITLPTAGQTLSVPAGPPATPAGSGTIETATAMDVYTFTGTVGQQIFLKGAKTSGGVLVWELRQPNGLALFASVEPGATRPPITLPETGTYSLTVSGQGNATGTYTYTVSTLVAPNANASLSTYPLTLSPTPGGVVTAPAAVPAGYTGAGNIETIGSQDVYTFNATAGQEVWFNGAPTAVTNQLMWQLHGPNENDHFIYGSTFLGEKGRFTFPETGKYALSVFDRAGTGTGTYTLSIATVPARNVMPIQLGDEVGLDASGNGIVKHPTPSGVVDVSTPGAGKLSYTGERDVYAFDAAAGQRVRIDSTMGAGSGSLLWDVRDPSGLLLARQYYSAGDDAGGFIEALSGIPGTLGTQVLPRSGRYSIVVRTSHDTNGTGAYGLKLRTGAVDKRPLTLPAVNGLVTVTGDIALGSTIEYVIDGHAGQTFTLNGTRQGLKWNLVTPAGTNLFSEGMQNRTASPVTLPMDGEYRLVISDNSIPLSFQIDLVRKPDTAVVKPFVDTFPIAYGDTVDVGTPAAGAGVLESGEVDVYPFEVQSGDAITLIADCGVNGPQWNLRDPNGDIVFARSLAGCWFGPRVLPVGGTYQLSISGATQQTLYRFTLNHVQSLQEAPIGDPSAHTPKVTRVNPPAGAAGGTTTFDIFGTRLPRITAVHVTQAGVSLPVELLDANAINTSFEARAATARVDLSGLTHAATYNISVDLVDGRTLPVPGVFSVKLAVKPRLEFALRSRVMTPGALSYAFLDVRNPTAADYYNGVFQIGVPCDGTSTLFNGTVFNTTVRMVQAKQDPDAIIAAMQAEGITVAPAWQAVIRTRAAQSTVAPRQSASGCWFEVYAGNIPSGATETIKLAIVPPFYGPHIAGTLGPFTVQVFDKGTHAALDAPDSNLVALAEQKFGAAVPLSTVGTAVGPDQVHIAPAGLVQTITKILVWIAGANEVADLCRNASDLVSWIIEHWPSGPPQDCGNPPCPPEQSGCVPTPCDPPDHDGEEPPDTDPSSIAIAADDGGCGAPVAPGDDPNALSGPDVVQPGARVTYTVDFENIGPGPIQQVHVRVPLDPDIFDLTQLKVEDVGVGYQNVAPTGNAVFSTGVMEEVNGATVDVTNRLLPDNTLEMELTGREDEFGPHGSFLPGNTAANKPAGQGYVRFSAPLKSSVLPGTEFTQAAADIVFNEYVFGGSTTPTDVWKTRVRNDHLLPGAKLKLMDVKPESRKLQVKLTDPALAGFGNPKDVGTENEREVKVRVSSPTFDSEYAVPAQGWTAIVDGTGAPRLYKYADSTNARGPIRKMSIDVRTGKMKIDGKGDQLDHTLTQDPHTVNVTISRGSERWCATFEHGRYRTASFIETKAPPATSCAAAAPAPAAVPAVAVARSVSIADKSGSSSTMSLSGTTLVSSAPLTVTDNYGGCTYSGKTASGYKVVCKDVQSWDIDLLDGSDHLTADATGDLFVFADRGNKTVTAGSRNGVVQLSGGAGNDTLRITRAVGKSELDGGDGKDTILAANLRTDDIECGVADDAKDTVTVDTHNRDRVSCDSGDALSTR